MTPSSARWITVALASGWITVAAAQEFMPQRQMTLPESIKIALNNSQELLASHEDVDISLQRVRQAEALFFPKMDVNANWSRFSVDSSRPMLIQPTLGSTLLTSSPDKDLYTARGNIYQTIYEGGRSRNTWRQARILYERARSENDALFTKVESSAKRAYYDLLFAQQRAQEFNDTLKRLEHVAASGELPLGERIRLAGKVSRLRADTAEAALAHDEARLNYLRTLNLELNIDVVLKGELQTHPVQLELQKMLAWATQYRSELRQTEYEEQLDALGVSLSLAERTPTVGVGASYERSSTDLNFGTVNWAGTLNVSLPLSMSDMFFGGAKVRERRAEYRQATLRRAEASDQIQMEVREAFTKYRFWQEQLVTREADYKHLQDMTDALRGRTGNAYEKAEAETLLLESQVRYQEAVHGHLVALAALETAVGHSLENE